MNDADKSANWLADVDGCMSCGHSHRGLRVEIDRINGDWFVCPDTLSQVRVQDAGNGDVSTAEATRHELSREADVRIRSVHYRTDAEAVSGISDKDNARAVDEQEQDDDDTEPSKEDLQIALSDLTSGERRMMYDILRREFVTKVDSAETLLPDAEASRENSYQIGGSHYGLRAIQHWDIVAMFGLDYFQGQITKYVMRWKDKNGIEDLEKAAHYLQKYIALEKAQLRGNQADLIVEDDIDPQEGAS